MALKKENPMQRDNRLNTRPLAHASSILLAGLGLSTLATAQTSGTYLKQLTIERVPEDVAQHPTGNGVAVVRAVQRDLSGGIAASGDEIVVVKMNTGERGVLNEAGSPFAGHGLTPTIGASDLVGIADMIECAVLIGQRHVGSSGNFVTAVDIVDLSDAYGGGGSHSVVTTTWTSAAGFGFVNDVAVSSNLCYAIVNHKNEVRVFDMDPTHLSHPQWAVPLVANPGTELADPTFQRDSVVVTNSSEPGAPNRALVVTCRKDLSPPVTQVTVLGLEVSTDPNPVVKELEVLLIPTVPDSVTREPHDVALTPNNHMAVVVANDVVALFDLINSTPALVGAEYTSNNVPREYATLADSVALTDTYAVTLGSTSTGWQADVYSISTSTFSKVHTLTGTGQPHDIDRSADGIFVAIRTTEDVIIIKNPLNTTLDRTDIPSPSGPLVLNSGNFQYDSLVVTRKWSVGNLPPLISLPRQYLAVIARDVSPFPTARVDIIDLYHAGSSSPYNVTSIDLPAKAGEPGNVVPASIKLLAGGRGLSVSTVGSPYNVDPESLVGTPDLELGTDAWLISLEDTTTITTPPTPKGVVFQCEREGYPHDCTDPLEASAARAISLSSTQSGNTEFIHTVQINP
jgi:hypothetical protein